MKIVSTVDFMVAAGDTNGIVSIFKIPKLLPDWLFNEVPVPHETKVNCISFDYFNIINILLFILYLNFFSN